MQKDYANKKPNPDYTVILFYKYVGIENPETLKETEKAVCQVLGLKGRIIISKEGINATLEGLSENIEKYKKHILSIPQFRKIQIKESVGTGDAFPKLAVKVRDEIVATKFGPEIDPTKQTGKYLQPAELKKWYDQGEDFVVIDMRNDYEVKAGHFDKTINVDTVMKASRELPEIIPQFKDLKDKKILTVCTGGVRCEKMSALMVKEGFDNIYQLHGGMHKFMEKYPGEHFKGTLYTFDNRMTMDFGGDREVIGKCHVCEVPTENFSHCRYEFCHAHLLACENCAMEKVYCNQECKMKDETGVVEKKKSHELI